MFKAIKFAVVGTIAFATLGGCATIVKGTTQSVAIETPGAPGAKCTLSSSSVSNVTLVTPASVVIQKGAESVRVLCKKECFDDGIGLITSGTEAMAAGNIIAGGVIGLGIDAASGAMNKYNEQNQITMVPIKGCKPSGKIS
jgi:hypothetical protein